MVDNEKILAELPELCSRWIAIATNTAPADPKSIDTSVRQFYEVFEYQAPYVVRCQSPWQMIVMPFLLSEGITRAASEILKVSKPDQTGKKTKAQVAFGAFSNSMPLMHEEQENQVWSNLWQRMEGSIDAHLRAILLHQRKPQTGFSDLLPFAAVFQSFATLSENSPDSLWTTLRNQILRKRVNLISKLHGTAAIYFEGKDSLECLKREYEKHFPRTTFQDNATSVSNTLNRQIMHIATLSNLSLFGDTETPSVQEAITALFSGRSQRATDKTPDKTPNIQMQFSISSMSRSLEMISTASVLDWLPFYDSLCRQFPDIPLGPTNKKQLAAFLALSQSVSYFLPYNGICFVCEPPVECMIDQNGRLHSETGAALAFSDGYTMHSWHGTTVPSRMIEKPWTITPAAIMGELNAELRRVMLERFGYERFISESKAQTIHEDECGILYKVDFANDEPLVMVRVRNSTPEPDGSIKDYFLRLPPTMTNARAAVAWTFGMESKEYRPEQET